MEVWSGGSGGAYTMTATNHDHDGHSNEANAKCTVSSFNIVG